MRDTILKGAPVQAQFQPSELGPFNDRVTAEQKAGKVTVSVIGGQHGDFAPFVKAGYMEDLTPLVQRLADRGFPPKFLDLSKFGSDKNYYVPWMQATYVLAINKKAMQYLPQGADVNALTYEQLKDWGANIAKATGQRKVGFPDGPKGLLRTASSRATCIRRTPAQPAWSASRAPEAAAMWTGLQGDVGGLVNPQSTNYEFMQEPLLADEVWIAWDHTARLINAVNAERRTTSCWSPGRTEGARLHARHGRTSGSRRARRIGPAPSS